MPRLTKTEIEQKLLSGKGIAWTDASKKAQSITLSTSQERRLFSFLLDSEVREPTGLSDEFVEGLANALNASDDPAATTTGVVGAANGSRHWRLKSVHTEGFGGLNIPGGPPFSFEFDGQSYLIEGPNGSGKSSLVGAILWALTGERPRDQSDATPHLPRPVLGSSGKPIGHWPPIACYPESATSLSASPKVSVRLVFTDQDGALGAVERTLDAGQISDNFDAAFEVPPILIETGLLMPSRLSFIRLDDGGGRLTDAVQKLTGLDTLTEIGELATGLCHGAREYLAHPKKELASANGEFNTAILETREALNPVAVEVPNFEPGDTDDIDGAMAEFGKGLTERAAELSQVVANDIESGLDLTKPSTQHQVISAIASAKDDIGLRLDGCPTWSLLRRLSQAMDDEAVDAIAAAASAAREEGAQALEYLHSLGADTRFQLKALGAQWHEKHSAGPIELCPLCTAGLESNPVLVAQLEGLRSAGEAATRAFSDNLNSILLKLGQAVPSAAVAAVSAGAPANPRDALTGDIDTRLIEHERYAKTLVGIAALSKAGLDVVPQSPFIEADEVPLSDELEPVQAKIREVLHLVGLVRWYRTHSAAWLGWWKAMAETKMNAGNAADGLNASTTESLSDHLVRLSDALEKADPYRNAAGSMRTAWKAGEKASELQKNFDTREAVAKSLGPLKSLSSLAESVARDAIEGLSTRISNILSETHINEQLRFRETQLEKKQGVVVRADFGSDFQIDATLVANTSWLRAILWAFLFALREEAVEQLGHDALPMFVFDDPQATFDTTHRHRWAQRIAKSQSSPDEMQVILATYDEMFLELIQVSGVGGRRALIASAGPELKHVGIFEGGALEREWEATQSAGTPKAGRDYMSAVRVYVEALLRIMLRGVDPSAATLDLGDAREKLSQLHNKEIAPWNHPQFGTLVVALDKHRSEIKHIQIAHHPTGVNLGIAEATDVETHWRRILKPALDKGFRLAREHFLLHGGLAALHAEPPSVELPEGYQASVKAIRFELVGSAAALSNGRAADGLVEFDDFATSGTSQITLGKHLAFRLTSPTLEPVARIGDLLLVKEIGEPSAKSLVVAISGDKILARRFELSANFSDVAVLTSQAINPREIAPPVIAHKGTLKLYKIIGVLHGNASWGPPQVSDEEACDCGGTAVFSHVTKNPVSLVKIGGQSAEPYVLNDQYLMIGTAASSLGDLEKFDGNPVVAADSDGNKYFKRLRIIGSQQILLESMDAGGEYPPVLLSLDQHATPRLDRIWPVVGVLFELPA